MVTASWPADLVAYLRAEWGAPAGVTRLSGIGGPGAYRYTAARGDVIVKCDPGGRGAQFYTEIAPHMDMPVPALDLAITMPGLGTLDGAMERQVAAAYPGAVAPADIRRAKVWSSVEFLRFHAAGALPEGARSTARTLAEWLPRLCQSLDQA